MANSSITPRTFWRFPSFTVPSLEDIEAVLPTSNLLNGLSVSEDDQHVYIEAAVPGVNPADVEVTFEDGIITIRAEKKEEEKAKKYQRKASSSFFYRVAVDDVDTKKDPDAVCKNGVM